MFAAGSQLNVMHRATELQADLAGEADGLTESNGGKPAKAGKPQDSLAAVLETAKRAIAGAAHGSSIAQALLSLIKRIGALAPGDQYAAHMAIGSLLTAK